MKKIFVILFAILFVIGCDCKKNKNTKVESKTETIVNRDINGFKYGDGQKIEIGARLNFHESRLIEAGEGYAIYIHYTDQTRYILTIKNNKIVQIKTGW